MQLLIPFLSSILYLMGGQINKLFRWLMGIPIAIIGIFMLKPWAILCVLTYFIATNVFSYGENNWTTKLFGPWVSMGLAGFTLGAASAPVLAWMAIPQAIIGCVAFLVLKYLDDKDILKNPWQELLRGFTGTILFFFA